MNHLIAYAKSIVAKSEPENIPQEFIVGARVTTENGETFDLLGNEVHDFISTRKNMSYKISLATDVGSMVKEVILLVDDLILKLNNRDCQDSQ